ncbi:MAG: hypothetical protein HC925_05330 [Coleofasciculaceae cyanobacterium SM2_3_26]|nr:hypothetical protein [Coleofasciculaceae cyanobacterium SM2_3_26]
MFFERRSQEGRILWSESGDIKATLENINPPLFQGAINEVKLLFGLPLIPIPKPKQLELERLYQGSHVMLLLKILPGKYGEQATLLVLRGKALKFYQQQKLANLGQQALRLAQQLQHKIDEIQDQTKAIPTLDRNLLEAVPALEQLLEYMNGRLDELKRLRSSLDNNGNAKTNR